MAFLPSPRRQPERDVRRTITGSVVARHAGDGARGSSRDDGGDGVTELETRSAVTELVQRSVEVLGRQVSGDLLTGHHTSIRKGYEGDFMLYS